MDDRKDNGSQQDRETADLDRLDEKLSRARRDSVLLSSKAAELDKSPTSEDRSRGSTMGIAFRISTDLVAAVLVGGVTGYSLDNWLGTEPFLLLGFLLLGIIAGFVNVMRSARQINEAAADSSDKGQGS